MRVRTRPTSAAPASAPVSLDEALVVIGAPDIDLLALDEVLTRLAALDPQQSRVVELRFFGGLTHGGDGGGDDISAGDGRPGMDAGEGVVVRRR